MPTRPKPYLVLATEKKSHRTKAELQQRKQAEDALHTGIKMQLPSGLDAEGKKEFERVRGLLEKIGKDDALYEAVVFRYCQLKSECKKFEQVIKKQRKNLTEATARLKKQEIDFLSFMDISQKIYANINSLDRQIQQKRKMMLDIEKENVMTIASALRSIPKKEPQKKH